jgi:hypothetical protein
VPAQGRGLNPLLQNLYMIIHPPSLYLGYVSLAVPYAFGMAAMITGQVDAAWQRSVRRWVLFSWMFLTFGLILGGLWAYEELGWGGYWAWDPVENAGLLPWFTATAFLHSVMIQERRGMMKAWNLSLIITSFLLTIVGTFMTRSGVVQSVHAFGSDPVLAWTFGGFMLLIVVVSYGLLVWRLPLLRSRGELESVMSREFAFLINNWLFLVCALFVLGATMWPTFTEWRMILAEKFPRHARLAGPGRARDDRAGVLQSVHAADRAVAAAADGVGPLLAWRKTTTRSLVNQFLAPLLVGVVATIVPFALGIESPWGLACFGLCGFTSWTIVQEFYRGVALRRKQRPQGILEAMISLVLRARRRYGGLHRAPRDRADVLRLGRERLQDRAQDDAAAGRDVRARRVRDPPRRAARDRGLAEGDDHGRHRGAQGRRRRRHAAPGPLVVLPAARAADDRGVALHDGRRGRVRVDARGRHDERVDAAEPVRQPADQLDLDRVRGDARGLAGVPRDAQVGGRRGCLRQARTTWRSAAPRRGLALLAGTFGAAVAVLLVLIVFYGAHLDAPTIALAVAAAALLHALARLFAVVRALAGPERMAQVGRGAGSFTQAELRDEKRRLLRAIKELEFDHGMGKLSQADFDAVINTYRLRAIEVMRALEGGLTVHPELAKLLAERDGKPSRAEQARRRPESSCAGGVER